MRRSDRRPDPVFYPLLSQVCVEFPVGLCFADGFTEEDGPEPVPQKNCKERTVRYRFRRLRTSDGLCVVHLPTPRVMSRLSDGRGSANKVEFLLSKPVQIVFG
jgi:hypothetical protein